MIQERERERKRGDGGRLQAGQRRHFSSPGLHGAESNWLTWHTLWKGVSLRSAHVVDDSQTVINVKGRRSRKKRDRERERGGGSSSQLQLLCSMRGSSQSDRLLQARRAHHQPMTGHFPQRLLPPQSPSLFLPGFFHWYSTVMAEPHANIQTLSWLQLALSSRRRAAVSYSYSNAPQCDAARMHAACCAAQSRGAEWRVRTLTEYR